MPKIIWFNQPTNHSGYLNLIYLTADGDVGMDKMYTDLANGSFIMGGPALIEGYKATDAAYTLMSFLSKGFHFFPKSSEEEIRRMVRQVVEENKGEVSDGVYEISDDILEEIEDYLITAYSKDYSDAQCFSMLLSDTTPESPIIFIDIDEYGDAILCRELARIYYSLPKEKREELGLKRDWRLPNDG